jgi:hypothetical protein
MTGLTTLNHWPEGEAAMPEVTSAALGQNEDGRLELVGTSQDDGSPATVWHAWQTTPSGDWTGWHPFGKPGRGTPSAHTQPATIQHGSDGRLEVFVIGGDNALWHRWQTAMNNGWSEWKSLGKPQDQAVTRSPVVALLPDGRLTAFVTAGGEVWQISEQRAQIATAWGSWSPLRQPGGGQAGDLAVTTNPDGRLQVFTPELDHDFAVRAMRYRYQTAAGSERWSEWKSLGKPAEQNRPDLPVVIPSFDGRQVLLAIADDGAVWHRTQQTVGDPEAWRPWASLGSKEQGFAEVGVAMGGTGRLVLVATAQSNRLWHTAQTTPNATTWRPWESLSALPVPLGDPTVPIRTLMNPTLRRNSDGRMELFVKTLRGLYQLRAIAKGEWGNPGRLWSNP